MRLLNRDFDIFCLSRCLEAAKYFSLEKTKKWEKYICSLLVDFYSMALNRLRELIPGKIFNVCMY